MEMEDYRMPSRPIPARLFARQRYPVRMKPGVVLLFLLTASCGGAPSRPSPVVSKQPISVRGWIADVEGSTGTFHTVETESARKRYLFRSTNVWIDEAPYVSGGVAEDGAFILLDVPPGTTTISFSAPGISASHLRLENIPGDADVLVPAMLLRSGTVALLDPAAVQVRLAGHVRAARPTGGTAAVGGLRVPVMESPIAQLIDRHEYPNPPASAAPLATVR